jgi:hypothetical protein
MRKIFLTIVSLGLCSVLLAQQTLNNDAIIKLVKAGLSDDFILSTINTQPGSYDASPEAIIALKNAGASDRVMSAIVQKVAGSATPAPMSTTAQAVSSADPTPAPAVKSTAQPPALTVERSTGQPRIFVKAEPGFAVSLTAALSKKQAPATIVLDEKSADYILQSASVAAKEESGASKIARCLFAYCIGIEGNSSVSVQLVRVSDSSVVWAYQVRKANGGPVGIQSLSEAIAKHLKNEFLDRKK